MWGLPQDAKNVSYHIVPAWPSHWYEFDTSRQSFDHWVAQNGRLLGPTVGRVRIEAFDYSAGACLGSIEIADGVLYEWTEEDRGQHLAYDRKTGRAYYYAHSR
jgi:hypothetical protein